jgi:AcrR family transcriptional regulator
MDLFASKGYEETSLRELAEMVGIKVSSLYNHFPSKQELLICIINMYSEFISDEHFHQHNSPTFQKFLHAVTVDNLLDCMSFKFPAYQSEKYLKIYYIIMHEKYRNEVVKKYVIDNFFIRNEQYVREIFDILNEKNLIEPVDSDLVAKTHAAIVYYWGSANMMGIDGEKAFFKGNDMLTTLKHFYNLILKEKKPSGSK